MKLRVFLACLVVVLLQWTVTFGSSGPSHHATALQYDILKTVTLKGVVSQLDWVNPHAHVHLAVKNNRGESERWDVELASPGGIIVSGLSKAALSPGTTLTIVGYPGKANTSADSRQEHALCAKEVTLADGSTATFVVGI